jgi:hypothetical protein
MKRLLCSLIWFASACAGDANITVRDGGLDQRPRDGGSDAVVDARTFYQCKTVDVLFVIDNSGTMFQEQQNLLKNSSRFIERIEAIQPALDNYHIGVISTDIGAGPFTYTGSTCKPGGDRGLLQSTPRGSNCKASYPAFLKGPRADLAKDFACIAALGKDGCGFEQQMESALMALTPPANPGFIRKNAPLAIIFVSDEDDCSADGSFFDPGNGALGDLKTRCAAHPDKLRPVSRYINAFKALKDDPKRLVIAAITGPPGKVVINVNKFAGQEPICSSAQFGEAAAGNRFGQLVAAFGQRGIQRSLCDGDLAAALDVVSLAIEEACIEIN